MKVSRKYEGSKWEEKTKEDPGLFEWLTGTLEDYFRNKNAKE